LEQARLADLECRFINLSSDPSLRAFGIEGRFAKMTKFRGLIICNGRMTRRAKAKSRVNDRRGNGGSITKSSQFFFQAEQEPV
jgi:hypothetical protein